MVCSSTCVTEYAPWESLPSDVVVVRDLAGVVPRLTASALARLHAARSSGTLGFIAGLGA